MAERRSKPARILSAAVAAAVTLSTANARAEEPEPDPEPAEDSIASLDAPDPTDVVTGPRVRLEVKGKHQLSLYGIDSEFAGYGSGSGGTVAIHGIEYRRLCTSPCDEKVRSGTGRFFLGGESYTASRPFDLPNRGDVVVEARAGHKALYWMAWVSLMVGAPLLISGATLAGLSNATDINLGSKAAHGALIGVGTALIIGSIPMFIFGRTRAKVRR